MIGKVKTGKSFGGCVRYNIERQEATILHGEGLRTDSAKHIIKDLNLQRKMNPNLGKAVGHIVLSWSVHDKEKLNPGLMLQHAEEYMKKMKISDTQYLIVQHHDREHPHVHLIYNRVDNHAKTISDQYQQKRNAEVCKMITQKYGYHIAEGKREVKRERLIGADKVKYEIYDAIKMAVPKSGNWKELKENLMKQQIDIQFKYRSKTNEVQGVSFCKGETKFKGSEIDRKFSYLKLDYILACRRQQKSRISANEMMVSYPSAKKFTSSGKPMNKTIMEDLLEPVYVEQLSMKDFKRKKKKKKRNMNMELSL